jgi:HSP20 family protein
MYYPYNSYCGHSMYSSRVKDNENNVVLEVPVPGFEKKDINVKIKENYLILEGKNDEFTIDRSYRLGEKINIEKIEAEVKNGVLTITLPKSQPDIKEIKIN